MVSRILELIEPILIKLMNARLQLLFSLMIMVALGFYLHALISGGEVPGFVPYLVAIPFTTYIPLFVVAILYRLQSEGRLG